MFCGEEFYTTNGIKKCCDINCSKKYQKIKNSQETKCLFCDKEFLPTNNKNYYCSRECFFNSSRISKECEFCGVTFITTKFNENKKFCSNKCHRNNTSNMFELKCQVCDKKIQVCGCDKKRYKEHFCSNKCQGIRKTEKGNPTIQKIVRGRKEAFKLRSECFKRDNYKSVISNKNGELNHHHLCSVSYLIKENSITKDNWRDNKELLFDINNVVTLLVDEHKLFHSVYGKVTTKENFEEFTMEYKEKNI